MPGAMSSVEYVSSLRSPPSSPTREEEQDYLKRCVSSSKSQVFSCRATLRRLAVLKFPTNRLSLEAVEALAAAATMRRRDVLEESPRKVQRKSLTSSPTASAKTANGRVAAPNNHHHLLNIDRLSLEAAEVLTDVAALHRNITPRPYSSPGNSYRGKYRCGRCGQMKVNHVCPHGQAPLQRSMSIQTEPAVPTTDDCLPSPFARSRAYADRVLVVRSRSTSAPSRSLPSGPTAAEDDPAPPSSSSSSP